AGDGGESGGAGEPVAAGGRDRAGDLGHCGPDEPVGVECGDRGGPCGGAREGVCGGGRRGAEAGGAVGGVGGGDCRADPDDAGGRGRSGGGDEGGDGEGGERDGAGAASGGGVGRDSGGVRG